MDRIITGLSYRWVVVNTCACQLVNRKLQPGRSGPELSENLELYGEKSKSRKTAPFCMRHHPFPFPSFFLITYPSRLDDANIPKWLPRASA